MYRTSPLRLGPSALSPFGAVFARRCPALASGWRFEVAILGIPETQSADIGMLFGKCVVDLRSQLPDADLDGDAVGPRVGDVVLALRPALDKPDVALGGALHLIVTLLEPAAQPADLRHQP